MSINRRDLIFKALGTTAGSILWNQAALGDEDKPNPKANRFLLTIHMGSACGMAAGLTQPMAPGKWPSGMFRAGSPQGSNNPFLNTHVAHGGLMFHQYLRFLAPMGDDMCLVSGTSQSLDHTVARTLQQRGATSPAMSPEWAMAVAQNMQTEQRKNPISITGGIKTASVADMVNINSAGLAQFTAATTDVPTISKNSSSLIWDVLKERYKGTNLVTVMKDSNLASQVDYQLNTLATGLPQINAAKADIDALGAKLSAASVTALLEKNQCADQAAIARNATAQFRDRLLLAGILAKTGIAHGMTISAPTGEDTHNGGACAGTAQRMAGVWAQVALLWDWIKLNNMQNDFMIMVSHEFGRSPYNTTEIKETVFDPKGAPIKFSSFGRDHGLTLGMMFINANVPKAGRIGVISQNLTPQATSDAKGTVDKAGQAFVSPNIVGSMLMRVFDDLFPTERLVRKHWPTFKEIKPILD